jgi:hypothetical protein
VAAGPGPAVVCHRIGGWTAVQLRWNLTVDPAEQDPTGLAADWGRTRE